MLSRQIASKLRGYETPFYLYDTALLRQTLESVVSESNKYGYKVHYAIKANYDDHLLGIIREYGLGIDCASGNELRKAVEAGFDPKGIVYAGVGKRDKELRYAIEQGILAINCESIQELELIERDRDANPDQAINCSGRMLSELFVSQEDFWSNSLRTFGYELGRFIYLMDAALDYKKDFRNRNYNPLFKMGRKPEEMEGILSLPLGNAMEVFERLPLVQDAHLLRNILYGGVWQQYYAKLRGKEKDHG